MTKAILLSACLTLLLSATAEAQQGFEHRLVLEGYAGPMQAKLLYEALHDHPAFQAADTQLQDPGHALAWFSEVQPFPELRAYLAPYGFQLTAILFLKTQHPTPPAAGQEATTHPPALVQWLTNHPEYTYGAKAP